MTKIAPPKSVVYEREAEYKSHQPKKVVYAREAGDKAEFTSAKAKAEAEL
ncbi:MULTISPECIES: hypothetical protein [unclassified Helicobacter]|nr:MULTISPECIES: hypothetical protein [unclassified Helicobacter]